ncbi:hypothetical protein D9Q98_009642 [Chlorella vulgaris]|uniref:DUF2834 domain-containing protein n=1 Tax=Chlorella vulgaris TaxID=3077 RepID=A0A9D4TER1_CHLVU|nr:hypothetical protein D9Q98_009642 [Chlorella vulgaris]
MAAITSACFALLTQQRSCVRIAGTSATCVPLRSTAARPAVQQLVIGLAPLRRRQQAAPPCATSSGSGDEPSTPPPQQQSDATSLLSSVGLFVLWGALAGYAFLVAPNQTPLRDSYFLEKLVGLGAADGVPLNTIVQQLFLAMGIWPLVYTALLIPSGKSGNGIPAWPFVTASYAVGAFALLPFMALWQPPKEPPSVPAVAEDLQGVGNLLQKGMESPLVAFLCLAGAVSCVGQVALAGAPQWNSYFKLLEESRFINVMTIDFCSLTALAPFWMANDAALRKWEQRDSLLPVLSVLPLFGPIIYLCLRPKAQT